MDIILITSVLVYSLVPKAIVTAQEKCLQDVSWGQGLKKYCQYNFYVYKNKNKHEFEMPKKKKGHKGHQPNLTELEHLQYSVRCDSWV